MQAQASYLNNYQFIPLSRTCQLLDDFYAHRPTEAFVLQANASLVAQIEPSLAAITVQLIAAGVAHYDESGLRVAGKLNWLHVSATQLLTYYDMHPKRGQVAMGAIGILAMFAGTAVQDHWKSCFTFDNCQHAVCNAHHLRELLFIVEQYQQTWAQEMAQLLLDIKAEVENALLEDNSLLKPLLSFFEQRYDQLIEQGLAENPPPPEPAQKKRGPKKLSPPNNLLDRLQSYKPQVLAYMSDFRVPFDNNLAERDVRMVKVKQKISGAFRSQTGAVTLCAIRSYNSTVRKHGSNVIDAIQDALFGNPFIHYAFEGQPE